MSDMAARISAALASRYRLQGELGAGGMATVFLAHDLRHDREVALKVIRPEITAVLGVERFLGEIHVTARLQHPHIMPLFDSGEADGLVYYVMPYVEGISLRERLHREKQLGLEEALDITAQASLALGYAHRHGIIHRDVKPENILLHDGQAMLADFGIALAVDEAAGRRLTETGFLIGTPPYMSPEQALGERALDGRSDMYSLACVLYEMLAGEPPFLAPTAQAVLARRLTEAVPSLRPARDVPETVDRALARALARNPADRFASMEAFAAALRVAGPAPRGRRLPFAPLLSGVLALAALGTLVVLLRGRSSGVVLGRQTQVTMQPGLEIDPALSPDGKLVAYAAGPPGATRLYVRQLSGGAPVAVVRAAERFERAPCWSPNGSQLLFLSDAGIETAPALGGLPRVLVPFASTLVAGPIAPDGGRIAYARGDSLFQRPIDGGMERLLATGHEVHSISWSPDGEWVAYVLGNIHFVWDVSLGNLAPSSIWIVPAAGGPARQVTDARALNASPVWAAGGRRLFFVSDRDGSSDVYTLALTRDGRPRGPPTRLSTGLNALGISVSHDGTQLAYARFQKTASVWWLPIPSGAPVSIERAKPLRTGAQSVEFFDISPDGQWLAIGAAQGGGGRIFRTPLAGGDLEQLTADSLNADVPSFSPNGQELLYQAWRGSHRQVFTMPAGGGAATPVTDTPIEEFLPVWDRGGRRVAMRASAGGDSWLELAERDAGGRWTPPRRVRPAGLGAPCWVSMFAWSPDGRWLATSCWRGGPGLVLVSPDRGDLHVLVGDSSAVAPRPAWSADSRTVYYFADSAGTVRSINAISVTGGRPRVLVRFDDPTRPWQGWGFKVYQGRFYVTLGDLQSDIWVAVLSRASR